MARLRRSCVSWRRRAIGAWATIPTPTAAFCRAICACPIFRKYGVEVSSPGAKDAEATRVMGVFLRDVMKMNGEAKNFRLFGPMKWRPIAGARS